MLPMPAPPPETPLKQLPHRHDGIPPQSALGDPALAPPDNNILQQVLAPFGPGLDA